MSEFPKEAMVTARIHQSEKNKLKKSGYNPRQAIEYFNSIATNKLEALKIEQFFLNREIEERRDELILLERKLERIHKQIDDYQIDRLSNLRVDSYKKIVDLYTRDRTTQSFTDFINGTYIRDKFISVECDKFPDCSMDEFCVELVDYYENVILISNTF